MASRRDKNAKRTADVKRQAKRDKASICGAQKRGGGICGQSSGAGTDHPGTGRCKWHSGNTRSGKIAAAKQELGMASPINVSPGQALVVVMGLAAGQLAYATTKVGELKERDLFIKGNKLDSGNFEMVPHKWVALQRQLMNDLSRYAKLAADAGIAERQTQLQEAQTAMMAELITNVMDELNLNPAQRKQVGPAIRRHLTAVPNLAEAS